MIKNSQGSLAFILDPSLYTLHTRAVKGAGGGAHAPCAHCLNPPMFNEFLDGYHCVINTQQVQRYILNDMQHI